MPALLPRRGATEARPKRPALFAGRERERTLRAATNRLTGNGYDAAGDQTGAGGGTFAYDAEGRMTSVTLQSPLSGTFTYGYDGEGRRVKRTLYNMANVYIYDAFGRLASEYRNGVWLKDFIYGPPASGRLFVMESTAQATSYVTVDALGSTRLVTGASRNVMARHDYLPFGKELLAGVGGRTSGLGYGADDRVLQRFTGQEVDPETGLDHFFFRYYSGRQGRFTTPDPLLAGDPANPQTWNRYAYVLGNPLLYSDPLGLQPPLIKVYCDWVEIPIPEGHGDYSWQSRKVCTVTVIQPPGQTGPPSHPTGGGTGPEAVVPPANKTKPCLAVANQPRSRYWTSWGDPNNPAWPRMKMLGMGLGNLAIGSAKVGGAATLEVGSGGLATGLALYGVWSGSGNFAAGSLQLIGAPMPNPQPFNQGAQVAATATSISGLTTLAAGGNLDAASQATRWEGIFVSAFKAGATGNPPNLAQGYSGALSTVNSMSGGCE